MPRKNSLTTKTLSTVLIGVFCFVQTTPAFARSSQLKAEIQQVQDKGLFGNINRVLRGQRLCIGSLCVNSGNITEELLRDQLRDFAENNAPITVSTDNAYSSTKTLPGEAFQPKMLDLGSVPANSTIPAGDYIVPVEVFCLQKAAGSPNGHRYTLGQYGGSKKQVLADLNRAAASANIPHSDIQGVSWAIQAGVSYDQMPSDMQQIVDKLIPQSRSQLDGDFWDKIDSIWSTAGQFISLPSLESFLTSKLGETGETLVALKQFKDRIANRGEDWRSLSDSFIISQGNSEGDILETPWSKVSDGVHARFLTSGNYDDIGLLELRVEPSVASGGYSSSQLASSKTLIAQGRPENTSGTKAEDLAALISSMVAVPEGEGAVQPLAMSPADAQSWFRNFKDSISDLVDTLAAHLPEWEKLKQAMSQAGDITSAAQAVSDSGVCNALEHGASNSSGAIVGSTASSGLSVGGAGSEAGVIETQIVETFTAIAGSSIAAPAIATGAVTIAGLCLYAAKHPTQPLLNENTNETGGVDNGEGSAEASESAKDAVESAKTDPNKAHHIFDNPTHDHLWEATGLDEAGNWNLIQETLEKNYNQLPSRGTFQVVKFFEGYSVTVTGSMVNGEIRIGTAWVNML